MRLLDDDIIALMKKRVYDIAGTTPKGLKVGLHDNLQAIALIRIS
jgi:hypothetical protein